MLNTLESLFKLARDRKSTPVEGSYTNKLLSDKSLSKAKVLEEINELIEAVEKDSNKIHEAADVFYHLIIYLEANNIKDTRWDMIHYTCHIITSTWFVSLQMDVRYVYIFPLFIIWVLGSSFIYILSLYCV